MSRVIKPIQMKTGDRCYPVVNVERLATQHVWLQGERRFVLTVVESSWELFYVLPLDYFFAQNEIIMINNRSMYLHIISRGIDARGKPILVLNKRYK